MPEAVDSNSTTVSNQSIHEGRELFSNAYFSFLKGCDCVKVVEKLLAMEELALASNMLSLADSLLDEADDMFLAHAAFLRNLQGSEAGQ